MRITLGVTGGVAAYKSAELVRRLQQEGHSIQVVMTRAACEFITPLTFAALSGQKVITDLFAKSSTGEANLDSAIEHIAVAQRTDLLLVAPATADTLAKFARGLADDFLSTLYLASTAPVIVAPAMNVNMWQHAATQENLAVLKARGVHIVEPNAGYLACGMTGPGRLAELDEILKAVQGIAQTKRDLAARLCWLPPDPPARTSIPSATLPIALRGKWAMRWRRPGTARGERCFNYGTHGVGNSQGRGARGCAYGRGNDGCRAETFSALLAGDFRGGGGGLPAGRTGKLENQAQ